MTGTAKVVRLGFDPERADHFTQQVFRHELARIFYLFWRRNHIVSSEFPKTALTIGKDLSDCMPQTVEDLKHFIRSYSFHDISVQDWDNEASQLLPYIHFKHFITYIVDATPFSPEKPVAAVLQVYKPGIQVSLLDNVKGFIKSVNIHTDNHITYDCVYYLDGERKEERFENFEINEVPVNGRMPIGWLNGRQEDL
jgi:hypothetical protein